MKKFLLFNCSFNLKVYLVYSFLLFPLLPVNAQPGSFPPWKEKKRIWDVIKDKYILKIIYPNVYLVNVIPENNSGDYMWDPEPALAINPLFENEMVIGTLSYGDRLVSGARKGPLFFSDDGGRSWSVKAVLPTDAGHSEVSDPNPVFGINNGLIYFAYFKPYSRQLTITKSSLYNVVNGITSEEIKNYPNCDYPKIALTYSINPTTVVTDCTAIADITLDNLITPYFNMSNDHFLASAFISNNANSSAPVFNSTPLLLENAPSTSFNRDAPAVGIAAAPDGKVYVAFCRWKNSDPGGAHGLISDIVVVRDDNYGKNDFSDLNGRQGKIIRPDIITTIDTIGKNRTQGHLAIAINPRNSSEVYVVYASDYDFKLHVIKSTDGGSNWSDDLLMVDSAINPSLAMNNSGRLGFLYQRHNSTVSPPQWETHFRSSVLSMSSWDDVILNKFNYNVCAFNYVSLCGIDEPISGCDLLVPYCIQPFLGDYTSLVTSDDFFYGTFSASNYPDNANFPYGVNFQRANDFTGRKLYDLATPAAEVNVSIDPYFFKINYSFRFDTVAVLRNSQLFCNVCECCRKIKLLPPYIYLGCPLQSKQGRPCLNNMKLSELLNELNVTPPIPPDSNSNDIYCNILLKKFDNNTWEIELYDLKDNLYPIHVIKKGDGTIINFKWTKKYEDLNIMFLSSKEDDVSETSFETKIKFTSEPMQEFKF